MKRNVILTFILLTLAACKNKKADEDIVSKIMEGTKQKNEISFIISNDEFKKYLEKFNEIELPFDFNTTWREIGGKVNEEIELDEKFINSIKVQEAIHGKVDGLICAYLLPINKNKIVLVYLNDVGLTYQIIAVSYTNEGEIIDAIPIHGDYDDGVYTYNAFIDRELMFHIFDSIHNPALEGWKMEYREYRKYKVNEQGKFEDIRTEAEKLE